MFFAGELFQFKLSIFFLFFRRSLDRDRDRRRERERERERERDRLDRYSGSRGMRPPSVRRPLNRRRLVYILLLSFFSHSTNLTFTFCVHEKLF